MCCFRENISQYQKALVLAESEKKDAAVKVSRLQEALNRQVKETEKSDVKVSQLLKKMSEVCVLMLSGVGVAECLRH